MRFFDVFVFDHFYRYYDRIWFCVFILVRHGVLVNILIYGCLAPSRSGEHEEGGRMRELPSLEEIKKIIEELSGIERRKELVREFAKKLGLNATPKYIGEVDAVVAVEPLGFNGEIRGWLRHHGVKEGIYIVVRNPPMKGKEETIGEVGEVAKKIAEKLGARIVGRIVDEYNYITDRLELYRNNNVGIYLDITYGENVEVDP